ncbi:uncharacterized protein LOC128889232 [Hylaeus anthracinus]|uniref:uncharacterized protein LOC128889232 n=1 Tax=Hylaeus anthracinus TaxID=313031 RepID=UPI0023B9AE74|nr:uncharacterized protein LOC128889232 [Hylaeus anthracinus]
MRRNLQGVKGPISKDGKHVQIVSPPGSGSYYFNYKKTHSIVLMAIANDNYEFIICDIGTNGRVSDGGVIDNTMFMKKLLENKLDLPTAEPVIHCETLLNYVFIEDEAFALRPDFLKSYNQKELDYEKRIYNYRLSRARRIIENSFGILPKHFRIFHTTINLQVDNIDKVVLACCVLDNFLRINCSHTYTSNDVFDVEDTSNGTITPGLRTGSDNLLNLQNGSNRYHTAEAKEIREQFKIYFNNHGKVNWQHAMVSND